MGEIGGLSRELRILFLLGAIGFFIVILWLLKRGKLNVQYSIIWLGTASVVLLFAVWPMLVLHLRAWLGVETAANLVFILLFVFVLLLLLSLSIIATGFAAKIKRLTQAQALLEKRVRELEARLETSSFKAENKNKQQNPQQEK